MALYCARYFMDTVCVCVCVCVSVCVYVCVSVCLFSKILFSHKIGGNPMNEHV